MSRTSRRKRMIMIRKMRMGMMMRKRIMRRKRMFKRIMITLKRMIKHFDMYPFEYGRLLNELL